MCCPERMAQCIKISLYFTAFFNSSAFINPMNLDITNWQIHSPKPGLILQRVLLKAASTHSSFSLQLFFSRTVNGWIQKHHTWIRYFIILFSNFWQLFLTLLKKNNGLLASALPQSPLLIKLLQTVEGSTWHPDEAAICWARSLVDFFQSEKLLIRFWKFSWPSSSSFSSKWFITVWIPHLVYPVYLLIFLWEWPCWIMMLCVSNCGLWHFE